MSKSKKLLEVIKKLNSEEDKFLKEIKKYEKSDKKKTS